MPYPSKIPADISALSAITAPVSFTFEPFILTVPLGAYIIPLYSTLEALIFTFPFFEYIIELSDETYVELISMFFSATITLLSSVEFAFIEISS